MQEKTSKIIKTCARGGIKYLLFAILVSLLRAFLQFGYNTFEEAEFEPYILEIIGLILSLLLFFTLTRLFAVYDGKYHEHFFEGTEERVTFKRKFHFLFCSYEFWASFFTDCLLIAVLPANFGYSSLLYLLSHWHLDGMMHAKAYVLIVMVPAMLLISFGAHLSTFNYWISNARRSKKEQHGGNGKFVKQVLITAAVYCAGSTVLPIVLPVLLTVVNVLKMLHIVPVIIAICLLLLIVRYARAIGKRKHFLRSLRQICRDQGYELSEIKKGYRSLFALPEGANFSVRIEGCLYECKLIHGLRRQDSIFFEENGTFSVIKTIRIRTTELFHYTSTFSYAFPSEGKKIMIINPIPSEVFIGDSDRARSVDVGDKINEYTIYNSTAFLNALERNVLSQ